RGTTGWLRLHGRTDPALVRAAGSRRRPARLAVSPRRRFLLSFGIQLISFNPIGLLGSAYRGLDVEVTLRQAQARVDEWIRTVGVRYYSELTNLAVLVEEVGEVARLMSRLYGDQSFKPSDEGRELADEFADVLFVLICL